MELCPKIQGTHQETNLKIKNLNCSNEDTRDQTRIRTTLASFLSIPLPYRNTEEEPLLYLNVKIRIPAFTLKFARKIVHDSNSSRNRSKLSKLRKSLTAKFPISLPNVFSSKTPETNVKNGVKALGSNGSKSMNSSKTQALIKSKSPLSFLNNLYTKKVEMNSGEEQSVSPASIETKRSKICSRKDLKLFSSDSEGSSTEEIEENTGSPYWLSTASTITSLDDFEAEKFGFPAKGMYESDGKQELWKKRILMGVRCRPLDFSCTIHYDENENLVADFVQIEGHPRKF